jgi:hypothetical protein
MLFAFTVAPQFPSLAIGSDRKRDRSCKTVNRLFANATANNYQLSIINYQLLTKLLAAQVRPCPTDVSVGSYSYFPVASFVYTD